MDLERTEFTALPFCCVASSGSVASVMADISSATAFAGCEERGERGKRGKRGHVGPTGATGPAGPAGLVLAAAQVAADGTPVDQTGFASFTNIATGQNTLVLSTPPASNNNLVVLLTVNGGFNSGTVSFLFGSLGVINVFMVDSAGTAIDQGFSIAIISLA